jgi:hypothetical protein
VAADEFHFARVLLYSYPSSNVSARRHAIIIPACNEEPCLGAVLRELKAALDPGRFEIAVGVNGSSDRSARVAHSHGVIVGEISQRGYGHGCRSAIAALQRKCAPVESYIFFAADGANDPADIASLLAAHEAGHDFVLGCRTTLRANRSVMGATHTLANRLLGLWCACLTGRYFADIGPLRLIERRLFEKMQLREWTFGWTIEAQIRAVVLGACVCEIPVRERARIAGEQKVSRVSWQRSLRIGCAIGAAGWRSRFAPARGHAASMEVPVSCRNGG